MFNSEMMESCDLQKHTLTQPFIVKDICGSNLFTFLHDSDNVLILIFENGKKCKKSSPSPPILDNSHFFTALPHFLYKTLLLLLSSPSQVKNFLLYLS